MTRLLACALGGVVLAAVAVIGVLVWAHHTYTVGVDLNWKAIAAALIGVMAVVAGILAVRRPAGRQGI